MEETPIIAIYQNGLQYRVEIAGKEIERMRRFKVEVSNAKKQGDWEVPSCEIEQYLPFNLKGPAFAGSAFRLPAEQQEETLE